MSENIAQTRVEVAEQSPTVKHLAGLLESDFKEEERVLENAGMTLLRMQFWRDVQEFVNGLPKGEEIAEMRWQIILDSDGDYVIGNINILDENGEPLIELAPYGHAVSMGEIHSGDFLNYIFKTWTISQIKIFGFRSWKRNEL